jgi:predicted tellurium resistance membrane protein TerC
MFSWLSDPAAWIGLVTLTILEIVLGIDNIIFISIIASKLPADQQDKARKLGLTLALVMRILLLLSIGVIARATDPLFELPIASAAKEMREISWRDIVLFTGGLFLVWKSVKEIHGNLEGEDAHGVPTGVATMRSVLIQILILDVVFSLDSVITAVGMVKEIGVMIAAVVIAVGFMLVFAGAIARFVERHPTIKMLALSFLILVGVNLIADGLGQHIPKGYTYFAMAFAVAVEVINIRMRAKREANVEPVHLHRPPL